MFVVVAATQIMVMTIVLSVILLFLGIGILVMIHICVVGRAFRRGFNSGNMVERSNNNKCSSMSFDEVDKLPCFDYKAGEKGSNTGSIDCAVCLENFSVGDKCRLLPVCKHSFHAECVDSWLLRTPICPICRANTSNQKKKDEGGQPREIVLPVIVEIN
ncbi:hypothetical protein ACHQM5_006243 [Ranunculus cassubicifolius]